MDTDQPLPQTSTADAPLQFATSLPRELGPANHANAQLLAEAFLMLSRAGALEARRESSVA